MQGHRIATKTRGAFHGSATRRFLFGLMHAANQVENWDLVIFYIGTGLVLGAMTFAG
jgi:hypothetical protein